MTCLPVACGAQGFNPEIHKIRIGSLTLQPGGFLDLIGMSRDANTRDTISTRLGNIPLDPSPGQTIVSLRNSRLQAKGEFALGGVTLAGYLESDFLNLTAGQSSYRWRQYWGEARFGKWEILGGQAWSLLRPNRKGFDSDKDVFHTHVIDAAYHAGLLGSRRRQFRLGRSFGDYKAVFAWETQGNFLARVTADKQFGHLEATAFTGHRGRRGVTAAGTVNLAGGLRYVTQEYWSKRAIFEALGLAPVGANGMATVHGLEYIHPKGFEAYTYGGLVYGSHSTGNRVVREWTLGANYRTYVPAIWGVVLVSMQYSKVERFTWAGRTGDMNFVMYRLRYTFQ